VTVLVRVVCDPCGKTVGRVVHGKKGLEWQTNFSGQTGDEGIQVTAFGVEHIDENTAGVLEGKCFKRGRVAVAIEDVMREVRSARHSATKVLAVKHTA
jgi:hypothetical protein